MHFSKEKTTLILRRIPKGMRLLAFFTLALGVALSALAGPVLAGATWGAVTGPVWLNPGYRFTVTDVDLTNPHQHVCMLYTVFSSDSEVQEGPFACSNQGAGTWVCDSSRNYLGATVTWQLSAHPSSSGCPSRNSVLGPQGSFQTGPTAVSLQSFTAAQEIPLEALFVIGLLATMVSLGFFRTWRKTS